MSGPTLTMTEPNPVGYYSAPVVASIGTASTTLLEATTKRRGYLFIQNFSPTATVYIRLDGGVAAAGAAHLMLGPGAGLPVARPPVGKITAISTDAATPVSAVALEW